MNESARQIVAVHPAIRTLEGAGFEVRRPIPTARLPSLGHIILIDHIGPATIPPNSPGAPTHPHAGMETLSYFLEGGGRHLDSLGNAGEVGPGGVQWMRAGRGIIHDEGASSALARDGGRMHMIQIWINLPREHKDSPPVYRHFTPSEIPVVTLARGEVVVHLIAGGLEGVTGPLETFADPWIAHFELGRDANVSVPVSGTAAGLYVMEGTLRMGDGQAAPEGSLVLFDGTGRDIALASGPDGASVMLLASPPLDAPIFRYGPFVAADERSMRGVIARYQQGDFGEIGHGARF